jgi:hypothetical protein
MRYAWFILATVLSALCVWGGCGLSKHIIVAFDAWGAAAPDLKPTLDAINRPCGGGQPCGTLATLNKTIVKAGDAVVTTQLVERSSAIQVKATMDALATIPEHVNLTADAGTSAFSQAAVDLTSLNTTIKATTPLLLSTTGAVDDVDAFIKTNSPIVNRFAVNAETTSGNVAGITANMDKISAHLEKTVDAPQPLWRTLVPGAELATKLWACAFEHVCVE